MKLKNVINRRNFISSAASIGAGSTIAASGFLNSCSGRTNKVTPLRIPAYNYIPELIEKAIDGKPLRAGLIGSGNRGTGAATNFLDAGPNTQIVALGDVFQDRIDRSRKALKASNNIDIPDNMCFVGFDSYKKVIDAGVDVVLLATPAAFRPAHFEAAVEAGKHVFMEKPACVDSAGYRSIKASAKKAAAQGLSVAAGTHHRYQRAYLESFPLLMDGMIGDIVSGSIYWNAHGWGGYRERKPGESDMEFMLRCWQFWDWLGGGIMEELQIHHIDIINWLIGSHPVLALGLGARHRRLTGDTFDTFSVNYEYENGVNICSQCFSLPNCDVRQSEFLQGTKGTFESVEWGETMMEMRDLSGNLLWKWDGEKEKQDFKYTAARGVYVLEHVDFINHIRKNEPIDQASGLAESSLTAIMGRESANLGKIVTWDEVSNSEMNLLPEKLEFAQMDMNKYIVPVPGIIERKYKTYSGRRSLT